MAALMDDEFCDTASNSVPDGEIKTRDTSFNTSACSRDAVICSVCVKELSHYTCPRCNIRYCSSICYKDEKHADCSEAFYKDCFMEGLREYQSSTEDRRQMIDMLKRLESDYGENPPVNEEGEDGEDKEVPTLEERMRGLDLERDTAQVWDRLTTSERKEFEDMLTNGHIGHLIEPWEPWWMYKDHRLVRDVDDTEEKLHPPILGKIPNIKKITKSPPSDCLAFNVINVLYGYAYTARLHNGDHMSLAVQAAEVAHDLSEALGQTNFNSCQEAVHGCLQCLDKQKDLSQSRQFNLGVLQDVSAILANSDLKNPCRYILAALSDGRMLLLNARKEMDTGLRDPGILPQERDHIAILKKEFLAAAKKVEFMLSWVKTYGMRLVALRHDVDAEFCALTSDLAAQKYSEQRIVRHQQMKHRRTLVEEIVEEEDSSETTEEASGASG